MSLNNIYRPSKHRHNTSDTLTSTSSVDSAEERSTTQRFPLSGNSIDSEEAPSMNGLGKISRHHQNTSMSSMGSDFATDLDRSENLFSLEEDDGTSANDSSASIPMSLLSETHSTPVMLRRGPGGGQLGLGYFGGLAGMDDPGKTPSPRDHT